MPFQIEIKENVMWMRFYGKVKPEELWEQGLAMAEIESTSPVSPHRITDLTAVEGADINFMMMEAYVAKRRSAPLKNRVRAAIITRTTLHYGLARMYQNLSNHPLIELKIFETEEHAWAWVNTPSRGYGPTEMR